MTFGTSFILFLYRFIVIDFVPGKIDRGQLVLVAFGNTACFMVMPFFPCRLLSQAQRQSTLNISIVEIEVLDSFHVACHLVFLVVSDEVIKEKSHHSFVSITFFIFFEEIFLLPSNRIFLIFTFVPSSI